MSDEEGAAAGALNVDLVMDCAGDDDDEVPGFLCVVFFEGGGFLTMAWEIVGIPVGRRGARM